MKFMGGYHFDKSQYFPMEDGKLLDLRIHNDSEDVIQLQLVGIEFDWDPDEYWFDTCNIKINPKTITKLPAVKFSLDNLKITEGSHHFFPFVNYQIYKNQKWENKQFKSSKGEFLEIVKLPKFNYKVFISHSNVKEDIILLEKFVQSLDACGIDGYFAESDVKVGSKLWDKIEREIRKSDAFLVLWTTSASESHDVREEIGIAIGAKKGVLIPIVEENVAVVGSLKAREVEYIPLDLEDPNVGFKNALEFIIKKAKIKDAKQSHSKMTIQKN